MNRKESGIGRIALRPAEAAEALGVKPTHFNEKIAPNVKRVRSGRLTLYSVDALQEWYDRNSGIAT